MLEVVSSGSFKHEAAQYNTDTAEVQQSAPVARGLTSTAAAASTSPRLLHGSRRSTYRMCDSMYPSMAQVSSVNCFHPEAHGFLTDVLLCNSLGMFQIRRKRAGFVLRVPCVCFPRRQNCQNGTFPVSNLEPRLETTPFSNSINHSIGRTHI